MPARAWLTIWLAAALMGVLWSPTFTPPWSTDTGWPPMVMPETTVPPSVEEPLPSVWAWAVLVTDLTLTTPPRSMSCTALVATALPTPASTVLFETVRVLP